MSLPDQCEMIYHMPFLRELASESDVVLEIGCGHGNGSTRAFDAGLRDGGGALHVIVDINPDKPDELPPSDHHPVIKITGDSTDIDTVEEAAKLFADTGCWPDLIFIDTDHTYPQMQRELELWSEVASLDTTWVFHDTWMFGEYNHMTDAIKEFCEAHPEWQFIDHTQESHGLGLMRRA